MRTSTAPLLLALLASSCTPEPPPKAAEAPKPVQQAVKNISYFDLGIFEPTPAALPAKVVNDALLGVELLSYPVVMECLVDPKNRGADPKSRIAIDAKLTDAGVEHKVGGDNLTPAGIACIQAALTKWTAASLAGKGPASAQVTAHVEFQHILGTIASPAVVMGVNDVSDVAGTVRLATPTWGDCFADWKGVAPVPLRAMIKVAAAAAAAAPAGAAATAAPATPAAEVTPADVTFDPTTDPVATKVAACLKTKLVALKVKSPTSGAVTLPYTFNFVSSTLGGPLPGASPDIAWVELDLQRSRRAAEAAIVHGGFTDAAGVYDAAVTSFKQSKGKTPTLQELKDKCAALLVADDKMIEAVQKQVSHEEAAQKFAADQKAKDPSWADREGAVSQKVGEAQKDLETFRGYRKAHEAACPKVKL